MKFSLLCVLSLFLVACAGQAVQKPVYEDLAIRLFIDGKPAGPGYDVDLYFKVYLGTATTNPKSEAWFYKLPIGTYTIMAGTAKKTVVLKSVPGTQPYRANINIPSSAYEPIPTSSPAPMPTSSPAPISSPVPAESPVPAITSKFYNCPCHDESVNCYIKCFDAGVAIDHCNAALSPTGTFKRVCGPCYEITEAIYKSSPEKVTAHLIC
jgi:hypothetical protein